MHQKTLSTEKKGKPQNGRKYLYIMYLKRDWHPEHKEYSLNSTIKNIQSNPKWAKNLNWYFSMEDIQITNKCIKRCLMCCSWCSSVDWVPACEPKYHWFDSQLGHIPGFWARSPVGDTREATTHWCFFRSLFPSFSLCLKINK